MKILRLLYFMHFTKQSYSVTLRCRIKRRIGKGMGPSPHPLREGHLVLLKGIHGPIPVLNLTNFTDTPLKKITLPENRNMLRESLLRSHTEKG